VLERFIQGLVLIGLDKIFISFLDRGP